MPNGKCPKFLAFPIYSFFLLHLFVPLAALALVLLAAVLHACWNLLAKSSRDTIAFLWWGVSLGALGYGTWLGSLGPGIFLSPASWIPYLISAASEVGYFVTLVRGYALGDLSLVYPLSRGTAPLFVTLWSALFLGERLPLVGYLGIALMVLGVYVASVSEEGARNLLQLGTLIAPLRNHAARWALASAFFISIYSLSDRVALQATPPFVYNFWVYAGNTVFWLPMVWPRARFAQNLGELRSNWPRLMAGSAMTVGAYVAVLNALTLTSASYVVAGRGTSVVVGALLGTLVLKEGFGAVRVFGALLMVAGLVLTALG